MWLSFMSVSFINLISLTAPEGSAALAVGRRRKVMLTLSRMCSIVNLMMSMIAASDKQSSVNTLSLLSWK